MQTLSQPLSLPANDLQSLFINLGPSLGLWRAAEIAAMREALCGSTHSVQQPLEAEPILDLGCGNGLITSYILQYVDIGLDLDQDGLAQAANRGLYGRLLAEPLQQASLPPGSLGTIISNSVLEHIEDLGPVLESASRLLRPGGRLIFTSPTEHFSRYLALPLAGYVTRRNRHFIHCNLWSLETWREHLRRAGLVVESVRPYFRPGWVRAWDWAELSQMLYLGKTRLVGKLWKSLPPQRLAAISRWASRLDFSAGPVSGGRLIIARRAVD